MVSQYRPSRWFWPQQLKKITVNPITLAVLVALYLVLFCNQKFWTTVFLAFHNDVSVLVPFAIGIFAAFIILTVIPAIPYLSKFAFITLILIASFTSWFIDHFGILIDSNMIQNLMETTPIEARSYINPYYSFHIFLTGIIPAIFILFIKIHYPVFWKTVIYNLIMIVAMVIIIGICSALISKQLISTIRDNKNIPHMLNPFSSIISVIKYLLHNTNHQTIIVSPLGRDATIKYPSSPTGKPRILLLVAGETARAQNFSLGGYERNTNPELAKQHDLSYFTNTKSCGTATAHSLPCMFSVFPQAEFTHKKARSTENLTDILQHAGIHVEWWENNTGSKNIANNIKFINFYGNKSSHFCIDGECQDGILLEKIGPWLDQVTKDSVLILHQMGSHGPAYFKRYPEEFRRFRPDCRGTDFNKCSVEEIRNAYDNTILYTDYFLSSLIDILKHHSKKIDGALFYMSDHGESLGEAGLFLHGAPYDFAPITQKHIPFILWMSKGFMNTANIDKACLSKDKLDAPMSHDNLFPSVLTIMNVETTVKDKNLDIFASCHTHSPAH